MSEISINKEIMKPYFVRLMNKASPFQIDLLKCIALIAMIVDHINDVILPKQEFILYSVGRLAMPLFIFIWAWNMANQSNRWASFARRQWIWAIIAQPFFSAAFYKDEPWYAANILFAFAVVSQVACWIKHYSEGGFKAWIHDHGVVKSFAWIAIMLTVIGSVRIASYGLTGIALLTLTLMCFLTAGKTSHVIISLWWIALILLNVSPSALIANPLAVLIFGILPCLFLPWLTLQIIDNDNSNRETRFMPRQAFYFLYSGHLGFLAFIAWMLTY